jgi:hypothetical protein
MAIAVGHVIWPRVGMGKIHPKFTRLSENKVAFRHLLASNTDTKYLIDTGYSDRPK